MRKKGDISINYLIIAAIALIVLIIVVLFFTGGIKRIFGGIEEAGEISQDKLALWRSKCELWCTLEDKASFENNLFDGQHSCSSLNVPCSFEQVGSTGRCLFRDRDAEAAKCSGFNVASCSTPCEVTADDKCKLISNYCEDSGRLTCENKPECAWS